MVQCQAITKAWPNKQCVNKAKYGDDDGVSPVYCGCHRTNKPEPKNLCQGITKEGKQCMHPVKRGQFCNVHIIPEQPEHDWAELRLYNPDVNWPDMHQIVNYVKKVKNGKELAHAIDMYNQYHVPINYFPAEQISPEDLAYRENKMTILMMQTFFVNYYLDYSTEYWQKIITDLAKKTENFKWLNEYRKLFRKKFDLSFREQTQKKYIEKILVQGGGNDLAKKIVNLL